MSHLGLQTASLDKQAEEEEDGDRGQHQHGTYCGDEVEDGSRPVLGAVGGVGHTSSRVAWIRARLLWCTRHLLQLHHMSNFNDPPAAV